MNKFKYRGPAGFSQALLPLAITMAAPQPGWAAESTVALEEVIVTAQHREENLQDAAIAVASVSGDELVEAGITQLGRLSELVPALTVVTTSTGNSLFIRGVGNFTLVPTSDPSTAFNYDGVYVARPSSTTGVFYDLARVEVLKGPQGTLYGRNATGGAINVIPVQPVIGDDDLSGQVIASYGNYESINTEAALNIPLGDNSAARLSGAFVKHDGYLDDGTSDDDTASVRAQFKTDINEDLTVRIASDYSNTGGNGSGINYAGKYPYDAQTDTFTFVPAGISDSDGIYTDDSQAFRETILVPLAGRNFDAMAPYATVDNSYYGVNAEVNWSTDIGTFTVIPAWRKSELDYMASAASFPYRNNETDEQYSLEVRFAGERIGMFDYTLGLYYFDEEIDVDTQLTLAMSYVDIFDQKLETESYAPFAQLIANITDEFRIVGGARYTNDQKTFDSLSTRGVLVCFPPLRGSCPDGPLYPLVDNVSELPFPFPEAGQPPTQAGGGALAVRFDGDTNDDLDTDKTTYRVALEYDVAPESLLYASYATGYRSGGFSGAAGFETYDPEYLDAYTLGSKNMLFDDRLQLNIEVFYWEYTDQQVSHVGVDAEGNTGQFIENIGKSTIQGAEVESKFLITSNTLASVIVQYLDAQNDTFVYKEGNDALPPNTGCNVGPSSDPAFLDVDCSDKPGYNSPDWTLNLAIQHTFELDGYDLVIGTDTQYKTSRYVGFEYLAEQKMDSFWQSNATISLSPSDERWTAALYVRNIEDDRTPVFAPTHPGGGQLVYGTSAPMTYGARFSMNF